MKRLKLFLPLFIFAVLGILFWRGLSLDPNYMPSALIDQPVPQFSLPSLIDEQKTITQDVFTGRVSLVNVWATWCFTCREEHGKLMQLAAQGIPIYSINYKDEQVAARKWLQDLGNPYLESIEDADGKLGLDMGVFGAPETYIVDEQGIIRHRHIGAITDAAWRDELLPIVQSLR